MRGRHGATPDLFPPSPEPARPRPQALQSSGGPSDRDEPAPAPPVASELWFAIHLPRYVFEALRPQDAASGTASMAPGGSGAPRVVVEAGRRGQVVLACDERAASAGVTAGLSLNSALALEPALDVQAREPHREARLLEAVGQVALDFTPRVTLDPPDAVLLEVRGSLRLFGGMAALRARLRDRLHVLGVTPCLALAPTRRAALWLARSGKEVALRRPDGLPGRLAPLPLACTRWPEPCLQSLATMGARTVGDCLRLPRDGFARRFGASLLLDLDRALARLPDPHPVHVPRQRYTTRRDLEPEVDDAGRLHRALEPLITDLCRFLVARGLATERLEFRFVHREGPPTRLQLGFAAPAAQPARIATLLAERLARLELPAPVRQARLRSGPLLEHAVQSGDFFVRESGEAGGVPRLVERLQARLGRDAVHGVCLVAEHRPESAWRRSDGLHAGSRSARGSPMPSLPADERLPRPFWLLVEPQPLAGGPDPRHDGPLELEQGPERIESGWWDGHDVRRDYYVARTSRGARLWIFQERRPGGGWFLHGVFG
jgi:protein ImuB